MPGQIKGVRIILIIIGIIWLLFWGIFGIMSMVGGGFVAASGEEGAGAGFVMGFVFLIIAIIAFLIYLFAAKGIANKKNWGKILTIILCILNLIPLGIIMLILLFSEEGKAWFAGTATTTTQ